MKTRQLGIALLALNLIGVAVMIQLSKLTYYSYLGTQIANYTMSEADFLSQSGILCILGSFLLSFYLIYKSQIAVILANVKKWLKQ